MISMLIWLGIAVVIVGLDVLTKQLTVHFLVNPGSSVDVIPNFLRFTYVRNRGAAFGMLADKRWVFLIISALIIVAMVFVFIKYKPKNKLLCIALTLIFAGGIGNMIDRVFLGYVVDMIDFCGIWDYVFNVADSSVCIGAGLFIIWVILDTVKEMKAKNAGNELQSNENPNEEEQK